MHNMQLHSIATYVASSYVYVATIHLSHIKNMQLSISIGCSNHKLYTPQLYTHYQLLVHSYASGNFFIVQLCSYVTGSNVVHSQMKLMIASQMPCLDSYLHNYILCKEIQIYKEECIDLYIKINHPWPLSTLSNGQLLLSSSSQSYRKYPSDVASLPNLQYNSSLK